MSNINILAATVGVYWKTWMSSLGSNTASGGERVPAVEAIDPVINFPNQECKEHSMNKTQRTNDGLTGYNLNEPSSSSNVPLTDVRSMVNELQESTTRQFRQVNKRIDEMQRRMEI